MSNLLLTTCPKALDMILAYESDRTDAKGCRLCRCTVPSPPSRKPRFKTSHQSQAWRTSRQHQQRSKLQSRASSHTVLSRASSSSATTTVASFATRVHCSRIPVQRRRRRQQQDRARSGRARMGPISRVKEMHQRDRGAARCWPALPRESTPTSSGVSSPARQQQSRRATMM